jgi:hypothetical protein
MGQGKNGFELAREVHKRWPGVVILIVSGRANPGHYDLPEGAVFIHKPYAPTAILRIIHDLIQPLMRQTDCRVEVVYDDSAGAP